MPQQRIKLDPDPPQAGKPLTICYEFSGLQIEQTVLRVTFTPNDGSDDYTVTRASNCVTVDVPSNALQITVEDQGGPSPDKVAPVLP